MNILKTIKFVLIIAVIISFIGCGGGSNNTVSVNDNVDDNNNSNTKVLMGGAIQGSTLPLTATPTLSTVNGSSYYGPNYYQTNFDTTDPIVSDGTYLYVATYNGVVKVDLALGTMSILAGSSSGSEDRFRDPSGITTDGSNLYVADTGNQTIRKIVISTGEVTTLAGTAGFAGSNDGIGVAASFYYPYDITTDGTNLYVADGVNGTIRKIDIATRTVTTLAGSTATHGSADGIGASAEFNRPYGITSDGSNLYVLDWNNSSSSSSIRKIAISSGAVTTLVSGGRFSRITTDGDNVFATDGQGVIYRIDASDGGIVTLAGTAGTTGWLDGTGASARFNNPRSITRFGSNLFVMDSGNHTIRIISIPTGEVTSTSVNNPGADGAAEYALFYLPVGLTTDGTNLYVADSGNNTIRKMVIATGIVSTLAGSRGNAGAIDGTGVAARFNTPTGVTTDGPNLYVADWSNKTIRKIVIATGETTTLAGTAGSAGFADGIGAIARFNSPRHITTDGKNLYVTDSVNNTIRMINIESGAVSTLAGSAGVTGSADGIGSAARFNYPSGITTDGVNLYVSDTKNHLIRKIVISTGVVTTLAGRTGMTWYADGIGINATFDNPDGITTDGTNLYVSDTKHTKIRKIVISTRAVSTVVQDPYVYPFGITTDGSSIFYTADSSYSVIRKIN